MLKLEKFKNTEHKAKLVEFLQSLDNYETRIDDRLIANNSWESKKLNLRRSNIFLLKKDNKAIGFLEIKEDDTRYKDGKKVVLLTKFFLEPHFREQSLGKKSIKKLITILKKQGITHVIIPSLARNKKAVKFFKSLGAEEYVKEFILEIT